MDCVSHTKWGVDGVEMYCGKGGTFDAYHCQYSEYKIDERAVNTGIIGDYSRPDVVEDFRYAKTHNRRIYCKIQINLIFRMHIFLPITSTCRF